MAMCYGARNITNLTLVSLILNMSTTMSVLCGYSAGCWRYIKKTVHSLTYKSPQSILVIIITFIIIIIFLVSLLITLLVHFQENYLVHSLILIFAENSKA